MTAVAIYARYSTDNQRDASIEDQIRLCQERAAAEGWRVHQCYTDHGVSGASLMRPGIQMLMQDAAAGRFTVILAEALDRLSRDQEDIAGLYKRMRFADVRIVTLSEGEVSNLHIGLKGTMNAIFLQDLADKTRRGLRGRIEAGKSGGGRCYGYDVVKRFGDDGAPQRGDRSINEAESAVVRRIFADYAAGLSPKAIAHALNREGIAGPSGGAWGASAIHGHRERGTGILNNEMYVGRLVWNRQRYIKDPETGNRVARPNPESAWIIRDVPALRIVDQSIWDQAKARQGAMVSHRMSARPDGFWDRRRPKTLFSGMLACGTCGAAFVKVSATHFGCAAARTKGTCTNRLTIRRERLEATVLDGLQHRLMDSALYEVFCAEYTRHRNALRMNRTAQLAAQRAELGKIDRELDRLVQAIIDGVPGARVKDRIGALEARKIELNELLVGVKEEPPVLLHPSMSDRYRTQVAALRDALNEPSRQGEAAELVRGLVDRIVLNPPVAGAEEEGLSIDLHGDLAGILSLATKAKSATVSRGGLGIMLDAGTGFEPVTFRL